jgi:hypothetical protein
MKIVRNLVLGLLFLIVAIVLYLRWDGQYSPWAKRSKKNLMNIQRIKVGMTEQETFEVMGPPEDTSYCDGIKKRFVSYEYFCDSGSFDYITVCFDSTMKVAAVYSPDYNTGRLMNR